jgi:quercetin dioxygenase-like cupin family protein
MRQPFAPRQLAGLTLAGLVATGTYVSIARATPAAGFMAKTLAKARFNRIDANNIVVNPPGVRSDVWQSIQKTHGPSDLYVQSNTWEPGGQTGWHSHPGHSLIIVTSGTLTAYEGDDPTCTPHVYTEGKGFVDPGGSHVHIIRNETALPATTIAVQLVPADGVRRIDKPDPGHCPF